MCISICGNNLAASRSELLAPMRETVLLTQPRNLPLSTSLLPFQLQRDGQTSKFSLHDTHQSFRSRTLHQMALKVEVAGYGLCQTAAPYSVFVVCVQQEKFEAWTVYRRYNSFLLLRDQLLSHHPQLPVIPNFDPDNLRLDNLESCRVMLDRWLQIVASNSYILRMQSMYQFLCIDANMPPPYLEIHWRDSSKSGGALEDMDMDEMFDGKGDVEMDEDSDEDDEDEDEDDEDEDEDEDEEQEGDWNEIDEGNAPPQQQAGQTVFGFDKSAPAEQGAKKKRTHSKSGGAQTNKNARDHQQAHRGYGNGNQNSAMDEDNDGIDIQSISFVEAEFIFNKSDEAKGSSSAGAGAVEKKRTINLEAFKIIRVVGKGSFGKVFLVRDKSSGILYAMKVLRKDYIIKKNQIEHTKTERSVLGRAVHHPYIVGLNMAFQTSDKLFLVLDYCPGGELFFHLGKVGRFPEERARFYAAQITLALEYVHQMDVIYRDLKPENVLLDQHGNVRLTDFGLSKEGVSDHSSGANSFCGTPEYIAPEVLRREGHGRAVDWWSLGALLYEMITGLPPFYSRNRETMFEKIMKAELNFPDQISENAKDLLSHLLVRDPKARLGSGEQDANEVKAHPFFAGIDWAELATGKMPSPWVPTVAGSLDTSQFDQEFTSMMPIVSPDVRGAYFGSLDRAFEGFTYVGNAGSKYMADAAANNYNSGSVGRRPSLGKNRNAGHH